MQRSPARANGLSLSQAKQAGTVLHTVELEAEGEHKTSIFAWVTTDSISAKKQVMFGPASF